MKVFVALALYLALSGCFYKSELNLHSGAKNHTPDQFFGGDDMVFKSKGGEYLLADFTGKSVRLTRSKLNAPTSGNNARTIREVVRFDEMRKGLYFGVIKSGSSYNYYPFSFGKEGIALMMPSESIDVTSRNDLVRKASAAFDKRVYYARLSDGEARRAFATFNRLKTEHANKPKTPPSNSTSSNSPNRAGPPTGIDRLDVGDGVYAQGIFSDELVLVVRIDHGSGQVKVRRQTDSTTRWVHHTSLITREQALANDVGRVAIGTAALVCLFSPQTCQN